MKKPALCIILAIPFLAGCSMNIITRSIDTKHTFAYSDQIHISYERHGSGGSPIVFLHGFGASVETWRDIQPRLAQDNTLFFLDLKGFGLSSKPDDGRYTLEDQAEIVLAFLKAQNLRDVTLVGHSYGGAVCLFTYFKDRSGYGDNRIQRLILIDAAAYEQDFPFFINVLRKPVLNWIVMNLVPARIRATFLLRHLFYNACKLSTERITRHAGFIDQPGSYNSFVECAKHMVPSNPDSISALIKTIEVPTLILWGENDREIPLEHARRLNLSIRNSTLVIVPQCGHIPHEEKPDESLDAILKFLGH
jgi:pimeloyl-ACP methyl ester carboxylesterase